MKRADLYCWLAAASLTFGCAPKSRDGVAGATVGAAKSSARWPGQKSDGSIQLPNQWSLRPAGRQIPMGDFPISVAIHPQGKLAAVLHSGYGQHEIVLVDLNLGQAVSRTNLHESFY